MSPNDALVNQYLRDLRHELREIPTAGRDEIFEEIEGHIAAARAAMDPETEPTVRSMLDRLGDPSDIAADARQRFGVHIARPGAIELAALVLLIVPFGWLIGVVPLWMSRMWSTKDKLFATAAIPGLYAVLLVLTLAVSASSSGEGVVTQNYIVFGEGVPREGSAPVDADAPGVPLEVVEETGGGGANIGPAEMTIIFFMMLLVPVAVVAYLASRLHWQPYADPVHIHG